MDNLTVWCRLCIEKVVFFKLFFDIIKKKKRDHNSNKIIIQYFDFILFIYFTSELIGNLKLLLLNGKSQWYWVLYSCMKLFLSKWISKNVRISDWLRQKVAINLHMLLFISDSQGRWLAWIIRNPGKWKTFVIIIRLNSQSSLGSWTLFAMFEIKR